LAAKLKQNPNDGCAGLVLSFIACFILLVIAPLLLSVDCVCSAVGCADILRSSQDSSVNRVDDNSAILSCHSSGETLHLTCVGTRWLGASHNCSSASTDHMAAAKPAGAGALSINPSTVQFTLFRHAVKPTNLFSLFKNTRAPASLHNKTATRSCWARKRR